MARQKFQLEFPLGATSANQLWAMLSTEKGLSRWIDADIAFVDDVATFRWSGGGSDMAKVELNPAERRIYFEWLEDDGGFGLQLLSSELTKEISLVIQDECEAEDYDSTAQIWQQQVATLQHVLGSPPLS